jgi:hypothetical protein
MLEEPLVGGAGGNPVDLLSLEHYARALGAGRNPQDADCLERRALRTA